MKKLCFFVMCLAITLHAQTTNIKLSELEKYEVVKVEKLNELILENEQEEAQENGYVVVVKDEAKAEPVAEEVKLKQMKQAKPQPSTTQKVVQPTKPLTLKQYLVATLENYNPTNKAEIKQTIVKLATHYQELDVELIKSITITKSVLQELLEVVKDVE